jgi:hypothetical protein
MKQLYYSHVYPHLIGEIAIWGAADKQKTYMQPIIRTHKKIIRLIKNVPPRSHTKPIMTELNILSIPNLYILRVCAEMHPYVHKTNAAVNKPQHDHTYTHVSQVHNHSTRYAKQNHQYKQRDNSHFTTKYTETWNDIPNDMTKITSLHVFKQKLRQHLQEQQNKE